MLTNANKKLQKVAKSCKKLQKVVKNRILFVLTWNQVINKQLYFCSQKVSDVKKHYFFPKSHFDFSKLDIFNVQNRIPGLTLGIKICKNMHLEHNALNTKF